MEKREIYENLFKEIFSPEITNERRKELLRELFNYIPEEKQAAFAQKFHETLDKISKL